MPPYLAKTALSNDFEELKIARFGFCIFALSQIYHIGGFVISIGFRRRFFPRGVLRGCSNWRRRSFRGRGGIGGAYDERVVTMRSRVGVSHER